MEILSDSLFLGNVVVGKAYGNTGITTYNGDRKIVIGSCSTNSQTKILRTDGILRAGGFVTGTHNIGGNRIIDDSKLGPVYYTEILRSGMFTNPKNTTRMHQICNNNKLIFLFIFNPVCSF